MNRRKKNNKQQQQVLFGKRNYQLMFLGIGLIAIGYILMSGGGSDDPNVFNYEMFSFRRIRLAPMIILLGFALEIYAIMSHPNSKS